MKLTRKRVVWSLIGVAAGALVVVSFLPTPVIVETAEIRRGPMQVVLEADGIARVRDRFVVSAPVAGRLVRIGLREGDSVEQGMTLAAIQPAPIDLLQRRELGRQIDAARAVLDGARAVEARAALYLADTERERARLDGLMEVGAVPRQQLEQAASSVRAASHELDAARYRVRAAAAELARIEAGREAYGDASTTRAVTLRSPAGGRVLRLMETSERVIPAGTPLMQVGDPHGIEVVIDLLSSDAVSVRPGTRVIVDGWGGSVLRGRVRHVEPAAYTKISALGIEEQRVNVVAELIDHSAELGDGYRVRAAIVQWEEVSVLTVPTSALFRSGESWSAFMVRDGRARRVDVRIGHRGMLEAEIISGLRMGERVIVHPPDQLEDGARVEVTTAAENVR